MNKCDDCDYFQRGIHYFGDDIPYEFEYCKFHRLLTKELQTCMKDVHAEPDIAIGDRDNEKEWRPYFIEDDDDN